MVPRHQEAVIETAVVVMLWDIYRFRTLVFAPTFQINFVCIYASLNIIYCLSQYLKLSLNTTNQV